MNPPSSHSTSRKREGDPPMLPSSKRVFKKNLDSVPNDLDDATHKVLDEEVLDVLREFGGLGDPSMAMLLATIAQNSEDKLDSKYGVLKVAGSLIAANVHLNGMLEDAWKAKSFKAIRNLKILRPTALRELTTDVDYPTEASSPKRPLGKPVEPRTPSVRASLDLSPPRINGSQAMELMSQALEPFDQYIEYLAEGKLDFYFNSMRPEDSVQNLLEVKFPKSGMLLLHDLGNHPDKARLRNLFQRDTAHLFAVSGSGKTRLSLEGLCLSWGFYISCRPGSAIQIGGSRDFVDTTDTMITLKDWDDADQNHKNADVAQRVFAMLLCARFFVLKSFLKKLPPGTDAMTARRRWVLLQVMPPFFADWDIFSNVLKVLRRADTVVMSNTTRSIFNDLPGIRGDIFPSGEKLFAVIDEAQQAVEYLQQSLPSTTGSEKRPVLHPFYKFLWNAGYFRGVILAGTGLSRKMVEPAVGSQTAKFVENPKAFVEVGRFKMDNADQRDYILKYLPSLSSSVMERIKYWFTGRYRFTASLIELLLLEPESPHRTLSAFAESVTGFAITDAIDLEEQEPLLSAHTLHRIKGYGPVASVERLFKKQEHTDLIIRLSHALIRWRIGSQTSIPIEGDMSDIVMLGIGHVDTPFGATVQPTENHPVYLCEPLVVLYLSSLFERYSNGELIKLAFALGSDNQSYGFKFEDAVLLVILQIFGGKSCALSDVFHTDQPWGSRKVTLVALKRRHDGIVQSCPVSWSSGSSDRLGLKAKSPEDVLRFIENPDGKCFLFPDCHMGPDLVFFLQDVETMDLILVSVQDKLTKVSPQAWKRAVEIVTPEYFYTVTAQDGDREPYAPVKYPKKTLSQSRRETPKILRIIATLDDEQDKLLREEKEGDVGILRWDRVEEYVGYPRTNERPEYMAT